MTDDDGHSKPTSTRFRPGVSGNPKGRPKRGPMALADTIRDVLDAPVQYREHGKVQQASHRELRIKMLIERAVKGDVGAADLVLKTRAQALKLGNLGIQRLLIEDWLPDYPGQTADQKTREFAEKGDAKPQEWWKADDGGSDQD